ncbi:serine/threonine-protein kinase [Streptomyces sp. TRM70308]|uniref:serine/threonine-protein kinase n=1 Tax=Streptomyces sp. TRM70308 TaxID=3131932 RepID=UPI003D08A432
MGENGDTKASADAAAKEARTDDVKPADAAADAPGGGSDGPGAPSARSGAASAPRDPREAADAAKTDAGSPGSADPARAGAEKAKASDAARADVGKTGSADTARAGAGGADGARGARADEAKADEAEGPQAGVGEASAPDAARADADEAGGANAARAGAGKADGAKDAQAGVGDAGASGAARAEAGKAAAGKRRAGAGSDRVRAPGAGEADAGEADGVDTARAGAGESDGAKDARIDAVKADGAKNAPVDEVKAGGARDARGDAGKADGKKGDAAAGAREAGRKGAAAGRETGRLLAGRYRLGGVQGRGGMGTVWRARDEVLGRTVAVKELRFPSDIDEDEKRRLITRTLREAKAIARIRSGSAVTVFDVVEEDDRPWIVMELVEGRSLADVIREDGPVTPRRAAEIGLAVLGVLRAAHREGIVHRDVKPSNVLIEEDTGRVVLTDFGIAKVEGDPSVTSTGMLVGAPSYISPERARGQLPGPPADMWSLGGLLYAAVEGHPPYDKGSAIATLTAVMTDVLEPPRNAGELAEVIYGLLHKDPGERLDDAGARVLLQAVLDAPEDPVPGATATVAMPGAAPGSSGAASSAASGGVARTASSSAPRVRSATSGKRSASAAFASGGGGNGGGEGGDGARRPRTLVIAAVVVVLVGVLGAVLAFALNSGDGGNSGGQGDGATAAGGTGEQDGGADGGGRDDAQGGEQGTAGKNGGQGEQGGARGGDGGDGGEDEPGAGDSGGAGGEDGAEPSGDGLPEGYETVTDERFKFSMALPEDWTRVRTAGRESGGVYAADLGAVPSVQVDYTSSPKDSALNAWEALESAVRGTFNGYELVGMEPVQWRGYPTVADWTYEHTRDGQRLRSVNRGFQVDAGRGHAILVTCAADAWDGEECATLRETAYETFQPVD